MITKRIFCNKDVLSLKHLTQFRVPSLKIQSSDNVASLWGKILLGSEIQEKNAENYLLKKSKPNNEKKGVCVPTLHQHCMNFLCNSYIHYKECSFRENAAPVHTLHLYVFADILYTFKQNQQAQHDLVLSVSLSQVLYQRKQDLSYVLHSEALF